MVVVEAEVGGAGVGDCLNVGLDIGEGEGEGDDVAEGL